MFADKDRSLPKCAMTERCSTDTGSVLTCKQQTRLQKLAVDKHSSLLRKFVNDGHKSFVTFGPGACIIKLITAIIYSFPNKLECLSINTRLGWKGMPGTNTQAYYRNRKLRP